MALGSGLLGQIGIGKESTAGTRVAPTSYYDFTSGSLALTIDRHELGGLRARRTNHGWVSGNKHVSGGVSIELNSEGTDELLEACFGGLASAGADPYTYTYTPGDLSHYTVQMGVPSTDGTVNPHDYLGCMVTDWSLSADPSGGGLVGLDVNWQGMNLDTGQSLGTASYPATTYWSAVSATLSIAASAVNARTATITGNNGVVEQHLSSNSGVAVVREQNKRTYGGSITLDYEDNTYRDLFIAGTEAALVVTLGSGSAELEFTCNVRFDGSSPAVAGEDVVPDELPFVCTSGTDDDTVITAVLTNSVNPA